MAKAWYTAHKKDMPREESREIQGVRAQGGNNGLHSAHPSEELNPTAMDIKELPAQSDN